MRFTTYVVLLRAVNVGGTGKLSMGDLKGLCVDAGFRNVQTYIASGNVILESNLSATQVKSGLEKRLNPLVGASSDVFVRTAAEMKVILDENPFSTEAGNLTYTFFLQAPPRPDALAQVRGRQCESMALGHREIYVHYPLGMGRSKLRMPGVDACTARNMNTVSKLVELTGGSAGHRQPTA